VPTRLPRRPHSSWLTPQSHQQLKEQLLQAAGVTGSVTESQHMLAGRLAALQLAMKQQRPQQAEALGAAGGASTAIAAAPAVAAAAGWDGVGDAPTSSAPEAEDLEPCYPTVFSDICCLGDVASSTCV
jgi:hypothetical protein